MSAEVEKKDEEETKMQPKRSLKHIIQKYWQMGIKFLEILLCIVCIGCAFKSVQAVGIGNSDFHHVGVMYTAFTGYILINTVFITTYFLNATIPYRTSSLFSIAASALFLITGILLIVDRSAHIQRYSYKHWTQLNMLIVVSVFSFVSSLIFALDAVLTFRRQEDFEK